MSPARSSSSGWTKAEYQGRKMAKYQQFRIAKAAVKLCEGANQEVTNIPPNELFYYSIFLWLKSMRYHTVGHQAI